MSFSITNNSDGNVVADGVTFKKGKTVVVETYGKEIKAAVASGKLASDPALSTITPAVRSSPSMSDGGNLVLDANAGSTWIAFEDQPCSQLTIANNTGVAIEFIQGQVVATFPVFDKSTFTIFGISNASQIRARRIDLVATSVLINARWEI